MTILTIPACRT